MAEKDKKYYWLKLKRDFFRRHDIRIIEGMPNGKDYILFYLKLLCESVDHDGNLRFSEEIPYNEEMLATITNTNVDIVRSAVKLFVSLHMMEVMNDGTYYMSQVQKMIGSESYWAQKKREQREKENELLDVGQCPTMSNNFPTCPSKSIDKDIELDIDLDIEDKMDSANPPPPPTPKPIKIEKHKYGEYKHVLLSDADLDKLKKEYGDNLTEKSITFLDEYIEMKGYKAKSHYLAIRKWVVDAVKERMNQSKGKGAYPNRSGLNNFSQREYDDEAINRMLRNKQNAPKTAGEDENIKAKADALRDLLSK